MRNFPTSPRKEKSDHYLLLAFNVHSLQNLIGPLTISLSMFYMIHPSLTMNKNECNIQVSEEEEEVVEEEDEADVDAEDPKVIKELIDLIKKVGK